MNTAGLYPLIISGFLMFGVCSTTWNINAKSAIIGTIVLLAAVTIYLWFKGMLNIHVFGVEVLGGVLALFCFGFGSYLGITRSHPQM